MFLMTEVSCELQHRKNIQWKFFSEMHNIVTRNFFILIVNICTIHNYVRWIDVNVQLKLKDNFD